MSDGHDHVPPGPSGEPAEGRLPVISVITIARNDRVGLERTRESVAEQRYPKVEHVIIDAASTDGTRQWLDSLGTSVRWVSESDAGRYAGMNKGATLAGGELLWFLHSGDRLASRDTLRIVADDWRERHWRWAYGGARLVNQSREVVGVNVPIPFRLRRFAIGESVVPHQAACFDASLFREVGGYDEEFGLAADQLFMLQAAVISPPMTIPEFLCDFDSSGAGSRRGPYRHFYDSMRARRRTGTSIRVGGRLGDATVFLAFAVAESVKRAATDRLRLNR